MDRRILPLALAADVLAVMVFAGMGRASHAEGTAAFDLAGILATAAPFLVGLAVAWAAPYVRADPPDLRSGAAVLVGTVVIGLGLRGLLLDRLPLSFAIVTAAALAVLLVGWRALSMLVAHRIADRVGG